MCTKFVIKSISLFNLKYKQKFHSLAHSTLQREKTVFRQWISASSKAIKWDHGPRVIYGRGWIMHAQHIHIYLYICIYKFVYVCMYVYYTHEYNNTHKERRTQDSHVSMPVRLRRSVADTKNYSRFYICV